jgi:hypothetical protein
LAAASIDRGSIGLLAALTAGALAVWAVGSARAESVAPGSGRLAATTQGAPIAPSALTGSATSISPFGATLQGTVDPGGAETSFVFEYGTEASYGLASATQDAGAGTTPQEVSATLSNLSFGTLYHYRILASNALGQASGEDRTFQTADAILSGRFGVSLTVLRGGAPLGQHAGQVTQRPYRFTAHCSQGLCPTVSLLRRGKKGSFSSTLRRHSGDHYVGEERVNGLCNDGERFRSSDRVSVYPTTVSGYRVEGIAGTLQVRLTGCLRGSEFAQLTGRLSAQ